jgi:hypothetical protein
VQIAEVQIEKVRPYPGNPRKNAEAVAKVAASLATFGWRQPIVVDEEFVVIAGHTRLLAAQQLGHSTVPVHVATGLTPEQVRAYRLADNRVAQEAEWDDDLLAQELLALRGEAFDLSATGFDADEISALLEVPVEVLDSDDPSDLMEPPADPITAVGDVITLGRHRLMCGDSTSFEHVETLTGGATLQMVYTDPPYGISIVQGGWVGGGEASNIPFGCVPERETAAQKKARLGTVGGAKPFGSRDVRGTVGASNVVEVNRYAPVIGDDSTQTAIDAYNLCAALDVPVMIFWGGNYYASALPDSSCWIVWDKENTGNFADAELAWTNQKTAVRVFRHMWNGMVKASERGERRVHPTQKPVALAEWCFEQYGSNGDNVLDLFGGSGSTLIAAEKQKRSAFLMELSPAYCDVIVARWEKATGQKAVRP